MAGAEDLLALAESAKEAAYVPYSGYRVGAALLAVSGEVYTGCNIENASYPVTICAERVAAAKAVSAGERRFTALAVAADGPEPASPCGLCRQFLAEFGSDLIVITAAGGEVRRAVLGDLLPNAFTSGHLPPKA
ncbi:MAG: cytidine deaminase [Patescibacteria group bacterium]